MSGNEIAGNIHNFFEENSSHHSQFARPARVVSNSNQWIATQGMNRLAPSSDTDSDQGNARLSLQTPFGVDISQLALKQYFHRIQSQKQQSNPNELMQVTTDFKGRSCQTEFQGDGTIPDNLSLMQRGFPNFGSQEGNSPGYGSEYHRSLERTDIIRSPINFLGDHQKLTGQHSEISQPQPNQQQSSNDMEWKQHLIAKQMQDIQRQQQFHQLHLGARQLNTFNQIYGATGQAPGDELPALLSGVPIANAAKYMPGELMGSELKSPGSSPMFLAGNMNWGPHNMPVMQGIPNGLIYSQDQGHSVHSVGYVPQQLDQSLHGIPVSGGMGSLNHYIQLQGTSHDRTAVDLMPKLGENHVERTPMQSFAFSHLHNDRRAVPNEVYSSASIVTGRQGTQGKTLFGNTLVQGTDSGAVSGSIQQSNHLTENFLDGQEQTYWSGKSHESMAAHVVPSHGATSLDPTEEKLLFGVDDDANWGTSLGESCNRVAGTYLNGHPLQNNDCLNVFPSLQSGTWSALVQEALEVSSSDTGHQEEWSGLSIQKSEQKVENHLVFLNEKNGKQNAVRDGESNLQNTASLTSKPSPLFGDDNASQSFLSVTGSQHPIKLSYEQNERLETDHSIQSAQQLSGATNGASQQPYNFIENSPQERQWQQNASNGAWAVPAHQHKMHSTDSSELGLNSQEIQHTWINQHKVPFYNTVSQSSNKLSDRGIESLSTSGSHILKNDDNGEKNQYARSNDVNATMQMEMTYARNMGKVGENKDALSLSSLGPDSDTNNLKIPGEHSYVSNIYNFMNPRSKLVINQQLQNRLPVDPVKHVTDHMFLKDKEENLLNHQKQPSMFPQDWDPSLGCTNKESGETHGHASSHLHPSHNSDDERKERHNSLLAENDHFRLTSGGQKLSDQFDRKPHGSRRFQFHPMGNLEMSMELTNQEKDKSLSQGPHPTFWGLKNQQKEQIGNSQVIGHVASTNSTDMQKENSIIEEMQHTDTFPVNNQPIQSFSATMPHSFSQDKRTSLPSQNVPMLFHKEVETDDRSCAHQQSISDSNAPSGTPEGVTLDVSNSHWQHIKSNPQQGFSLKLAPPSQRQLAMGDSFTMQSLHRVNNFVPRNIESVTETAQRAWSSSTTSAIALPTIGETSQRENFDNKPAMSAQASKEALYSKTKGSSLGMTTHIMNQSIVQQQQKQQNISHAPQKAQFDQPINHSFGSKVNVDGHLKRPLTPQAHDSHDRPLIGQTSQALFHGIPGKVPATKHTSVIDNGAPTSSQFYSQDGDHSDMVNASSNRNNSSEQRPDVETLSANQTSAASFVSQQGRYSKIFNNLWRNASTQQPSGLHPQKFAPNLLESINPLQPTQQVDDQSMRKGGNASSEVGMCSTNSQQSNYGEENPSKDSSSEQKPAMDVDASPRVVSASPVQEHDSKYLSDKSSVASVSSFVRLHQHAENQRERVNLPTASTSINDVQKHNYSLLQQMQAMKGTDSDPSNFAGKRLKGIECGADASMVDWAGGEKYICEQKAVCRESAAASHPTDVKMLSFSSRDNEDRSTNASSHLTVGQSASCRLATTSRQHEIQSSYVSRSSVPTTLTAGNERRLINPQMAPSWFEQYGNYKDSQTSTMSDSVGSFQRSAKAANQHYFFSKTSEIVDDDAIMKKRNDLIPENSSPSSAAADFFSSPHPKIKVADESLVQARKKRKIVTLDHLSWHRQVTQSSQSLQSFSMAETDWAKATNRLIEKIEDDVETMDDVPSTTRSKRRLILTTRLMQQLLPPVPAKFLFTDAVASYEKVIYYTTRVTLGEVCSLISFLESDSCLRLESGNMISEKYNTSKNTEEFFSKIVESFIVRLRKLQSNFLRLDDGSSIVDVRMECQDVERGSIINRFAKFHGRGPMDGVEGSSTSEAAHRRSFIQRNVTVVPMPRNVPDGVICLSL